MMGSANNRAVLIAAETRIAKLEDLLQEIADSVRSRKLKERISEILAEREK